MCRVSAVALIVALVVTVASVSRGATPTTINYQGYLTSPDGSAVADGSYSVMFRIYDAPSGGNLLWSELQTVSAVGGLFSVLLGAVNPLSDTVFNETTRYLGMIVNADPELTPRTALVSVPYALRVNTIDGATGGQVSGKLSIGPGHTNSGVHTFVAGAGNSVTGDTATIAGGSANTASGAHSVVTGGNANSTSGAFATVSGGSQNNALDSFIVIGGGQRNNVDSSYAVIGGGMENYINASYSVIGGGIWDTISGSGSFSVIAGGVANTVTDGFATIAGGANNSISNITGTIGGGAGNDVSGQGATIPGGSSNVASGSFSFAAGWRAQAKHFSSFVWSDSSFGGMTSTQSAQFLIGASNGVGINTNVTSTGALNVSPNADGVGLHLLKGTKDITWPTNTVLQLGQWDGTTFDERMRIGAGANDGVAVNTTVTANGALNVGANADGVTLYLKGGTKDITWPTNEVLQFGQWDGATFTERMRISASLGYVGIGTAAPTEKLHVVGNICYTGSISACSDSLYKRNIEAIEHPLEKIGQLRGVNFEWKREEFSEMEFPEGEDVGVIAQDVEKVLPSLVTTNPDGYKSVDYTKIVALLIEGIKAQQIEIDQLKKEVSEQNNR